MLVSDWAQKYLLGPIHPGSPRMEDYVFLKIVPLKTTTPPSFVQYKFLSFDLFVGGKNNKSCQELITLPLPINQL